MYSTTHDAFYYDRSQYSYKSSYRFEIVLIAAVVAAKMVGAGLDDACLLPSNVGFYHIPQSVIYISADDLNPRHYRPF